MEGSNGFRVQIYPDLNGVKIKYNHRYYMTPGQFNDEMRKGMRVDGFDIAVSVGKWGPAKFFECQEVKQGIEKKFVEMNAS